MSKNELSVKTLTFIETLESWKFSSGKLSEAILRTSRSEVTRAKEILSSGLAIRIRAINRTDRIRISSLVWSYRKIGCPVDIVH